MTAQLNELKAALAYHQGGDVADITNDDVKQWGLRQFQAIVQKHRKSIIDTANPVSSDPIAS
jgi:hypothetical protein